MVNEVNHNSMDSLTQRNDKKLYPCIPTDILWIPKNLRHFIGYLTITLFSFIFLIVPIAVIQLIYVLFYGLNEFSIAFLSIIAISMIMPPQEWAKFRTVGQLWYEILDFKTNLDPAILNDFVENLSEQYIIGMHPHGVIPFQAILWASYCHQYLRNNTRQLYGFGAGADIVTYLPILKNIMGYLTAGSANYKVLKEGLLYGKCASANAVGRKPRNLYILPGGIAEIFTSTPRRHTIVFSNRRGLIKLSLETGAQLIPCYVFGGTDFFYNLATGQGFLSKLSRKFKIGITIFWGWFFLPIPFHPKITMCIADPIPVEKWVSDESISAQAIEELHKKYVESITKLFDDYKEAAGYPDATLEIL